jgi:hypothetical protein
MAVSKRGFVGLWDTGALSAPNFSTARGSSGVPNALGEGDEKPGTDVEDA